MTSNIMLSPDAIRIEDLFNRPSNWQIALLAAALGPEPKSATFGYEHLITTRAQAYLRWLDKQEDERVFNVLKSINQLNQDDNAKLAKTLGVNDASV